MPGSLCCVACEHRQIAGFCYTLLKDFSMLWEKKARNPAVFAGYVNVFLKKNSHSPNFTDLF